MYLVLPEEQKIIAFKKEANNTIKVVGYTNFDVFSKELARTEPLDTGWIRPGTVRKIVKGQNETYVHIWPFNTSITSHIRIGSRNHQIQLFVPNLITVITFQNGCYRSMSIGALKTESLSIINDETPVYYTNFPNTGSDHSICWGSAFPKKKDGEDLQMYCSRIVQAFLTSTFNGDLICYGSDGNHYELYEDVLDTFIAFHAQMIQNNQLATNSGNAEWKLSYLLTEHGYEL